tara:strand:+ start:2797 stop:4887 length:2091 start_codon:yes stop_codon:yes gene_type:complete
MDDLHNENFENNFESQIKKIETLINNKNYVDALKDCLNLEKKYPFSAELFFMIARVYKNLSQFDSAETYYNKVISINPDHPDTLNNLGNIFNAKGRAKEAINLFQKVILLVPTAPQPYSNIAQSYLLLGDYEKGIKFSQKAIELSPNFIDAYLTLAKSQIRGNFYKDALNTVSKCLDFDHKNQELLQLFTNILLYNPISEYDFALDKKIELLSDNNDFEKIFPILLLRMEIHPDMSALLSQIDNINSREDVIKAVEKVVKIPFLMEILESGLNSNIKIEKLLTELRKVILYNRDSLINNKNIIKFQKCLTLQCFNNEFAFAQTDEENKIIQKLEKDLKTKADKNQVIPSLDLLCLSSYKQISDFDWIRSILYDEEIEQVFKLVVSEPMLERSIKPLLNSISTIEDETSKLVEAQYSDSPYPRWSYIPKNDELTLDFFIKTKNLKLAKTIENLQNPPEILIAGCGTGVQSISVAQQFPRSNVLALDLSKSSLAYALRKTKELGISNINYVHGDILDLHKINKKFDVIHCTGVLHHMRSPSQGLECLIETLKEDGLMKLGLYSNIARTEINKVQNLIKKNKIPFTNNSIHSFRQNMINDNHILINEFNTSIDFFSLSGFRDLYFNIQETQYNIPEIKKIINNYNLNFCGFEFQHNLHDVAFKEMFPDTNSEQILENWDVYEKHNKNTFFNMYQFWIQK